MQLYSAVVSIVSSTLNISPSAILFGRLWHIAKVNARYIFQMTQTCVTLGTEKWWVVAFWAFYFKLWQSSEAQSCKDYVVMLSTAQSPCQIFVCLCFFFFAVVSKQRVRGSQVKNVSTMSFLLMASKRLWWNRSHHIFRLPHYDCLSRPIPCTMWAINQLNVNEAVFNMHVKESCFLQSATYKAAGRDVC